MRLRLAALLAVLCLPLLATAQPLADRIPAESLIYFACQGTQTLPPAYDQSHLKAMVEASNLQQLVKTWLPALINRIAQDKPQDAENLKTLVALLTPMIEHPCAFYVGGINMERPQRPQPMGGILCDAGPDAEALLNRINGLLAKAPNVPPMLKVFRKGGLVAVTFGYADEAAALAGEGGSAKPLAANESFRSALGQVHKSPLSVLYVNIDGLRALIDDAVAKGNNAQAQQMWPKVRDALGLTGLKQFIATSTFDGADWATLMFVAAPAPRVGLLTLMDEQPISNETLRTIPKSASAMAVGHVNIAKFLAELRIAAGKVDPERGPVLFDQGMGAAQLALGGVNLQNDLFGSLGSEWACYFDESFAGPGPLGCVFMNRLAKPAEAERAIKRLQLFMENTSNMLLVTKNLQLTFDQVKMGDLTVNYCMLPVVAPSWAIKDGIFYSALYPQVLAPAAGHVAANGPSILDNPQFTALRQRLGGNNITSISFVDLSKTSGNVYQTMLALAQLGMGLSDMAGAKAPVIVVPPLAKLREHLSPAGSVTWSDAAGLHVKQISPFPGAELLGIWP